MTSFASRFVGAVVIAGSLFATGAATAQIPQPPLVNAKAWILVDARTGSVLAGENTDERLPPASLTKMMTTYVADVVLHEGRIAMTDQVRISEKAWRTGMKEGSRMFLDVGSSVLLEDILRGIIIQSGNDASVALAEHIAGSEEQFVQLMNAQAQRLGMTNTAYLDASGLNDAQYSSARDLATLARAIIHDYPQNYPMYAEKEFKYNVGKPQQNRNDLLWRDPSVDGLKTGHTEAAGYCLVASAKRGDTRMVSVVLNTASKKARADESAKLLDWGFRNFETYAPYAAGTVLGEGKVWMGVMDKVVLGLGEDILLTLPRGTQQKLKAAITVNPELRAPIRKGDPLGTFVIRNGDAVVIEKPLLAMNDVEEANFFVRIWHWITMLFDGMFG